MIRAIVLILLAVAALQTLPFSQTEAEWNWTNKHFEAALDSLMPLQRTQGVYVVYRANRDLYTEVPEYWFLIGYDGNPDGHGLQPTLSAHVRAADSVSIYDQLMRMHRKEPNEDASSMVRRMKLTNWDTNETACPAIRKQVQKLQELQSKPLDLNSEVIVLHPMNHQFHIQAAGGDMKFTIWDDEQPLVLWAVETRRVLESCTKVQ